MRHSSTISNRIPSSPALTRPESADDLAPFVCQRDSCPNAGNAEAGKVCYDHRISITFASETPPPMYLCIECANEIHRSHPNQMFYDILHPMQQVSMICENKVSRVSPKFHFDLLISNRKREIFFLASIIGNLFVLDFLKISFGQQILRSSFCKAWNNTLCLDFFISN